jgi:hypothetical protein
MIDKFIDLNRITTLMSDPTQFIVPLAVAHRLMAHEGIVAVGRDYFNGTQCSLHSYVDICKRTYVMQLYDALDPDLLSSRLNALAKYSHSAFLPNVVRPVFMSTRKSQKASYELAIFYETTGIG